MSTHALAAQASVSLANNGGDIGKTLKDLGSSNNIKKTLVAMATASVGTSVAGQGVSAVAAQTAAGCATGSATGAGCEQGAKRATVLSTAGETYQSLVGYAANAGQGDANGMVKTGTRNEDGTLKTNPDGTPETAKANAADQAGGIQVALSYGQSSSQSNSSATSDTARGSTVKAGGTTTIKALAGGEASNLTVQGSDVSGKAVNLEADNKVNLVAAQNTNSQTSSSGNSSASVGIAAQLGNQGGGIGFTGSVSKGSGNGNGSETTYTKTHVSGVDGVIIKSGSDTNIKGATVEGKQVIAKVGGNLNIESPQDTVTYAEQNKQVGASGMIGAGAQR